MYSTIHIAYSSTSIFDPLPGISSKIAEEQDFIIDNKSEKMAEINRLYDTIQERIIVSEKKLPVRPFIIGKTTAVEETDRLENSDFEFELSKVSTYVMENLPLGLENKSITSDFTYDIRGKANLFVDYRSKYNYKPEEEVA